MKVKEFWEFLCEEMDYRFFAGVPCKGFKPLYDSMSPKFMHYIPAVNENVALALTSGVSIAGTKSAVLVKFEGLCRLFGCLVSINIQYKVPVLILTYRDASYGEIIKSLTSHGIPHRVLRNVKKDLRYLTKRMDTLGLPGVAIIEEGTLE